jgi:hypothetical protein
MNGAEGISDIEGKVTGVGASKPGGERVSIKKEEGRREAGIKKGERSTRRLHGLPLPR